MPANIISPLRLHQFSLIAAPGRLAIIDASWFMPNSERNPRTEFLAKRLPGAGFLDLDEVAEPHELGLKHMLPKERVFADACENLGIQRNSHVVIYDSQGVFSSPRALFMFRAFGHATSCILDGGLPRWEAEGFMTEGSRHVPRVKKTVYPTPTLDQDAIRSYEQIVQNASRDSSIAELVLDARSRGRFDGTDPEPRPGLSSGHIPNSCSLPFNLFLQSNVFSGTDRTYTTVLPPELIRQALIDAVGLDQAELIIDGKKPVVTSCGSGMTAAILWLGLKLLGVEQIGLYDESWTGYASREESEIVKSA